MKAKTYFVLVAMLALGILCFLGQRTVRAADPDTTRKDIKHQMKHIASFMNRVKSGMNCHYGAVAGNILNGISGMGNYSDSLSAARNRAFRECNKNGGGCEELFTITIHNDTPEKIRIFLFHPWETDLSSSNDSWCWTFEPGEQCVLAGDGNTYYIPKRFYLKAESTESNRHWDVRRIEDYNTHQRNYSVGQNLKIRFTMTK